MDTYEEHLKKILKVVFKDEESITLYPQILSKTLRSWSNRSWITREDNTLHLTPIGREAVKEQDD